MLEKLFDLSRAGTDIKTEFRAGTITFLSMAYNCCAAGGPVQGRHGPRSCNGGYLHSFSFCHTFYGALC